MNASPISETISDAVVIAKRDLLVWLRVPSFIFFSIIQPVMFVLLFRYVFGGAINVPNAGGYGDFLMPGIIAQSAAFASFGTAIGLAKEIQLGVVDRFRSMPMARSAVINGRLLADTLRIAITTLVILFVGILVGFRFHDSLLEAISMIVLAIVFGVVITIVSAYCGIALKNEESVQSFGLVWLFPLTFVSSAFVPVQSMPGWMQVFANNQPVTIVVNAMRNLALGQPSGHDVLLSAIWLIAIAAVFTPLAVRSFSKIS